MLRDKRQAYTINCVSIVLMLMLLLASCCVQAQTHFTDVTTTSGINHQFVVYEGMFGGGACVIDFDNDGLEDVFITGGMNDDVLYKNKGNGTFENVFESSGLTITKKYVTQGVTSADVNMDGFIDLFVTTVTVKDSVKRIPRAQNLLFLNNGNGTFKDVSKEFGLEDLLSFSTGASFGDFNHDGYPDLYIGNYFFAYEGSLSLINDATIVNATQIAKGYLLENNKGRYFENVYDDYDLKHKGFGFGGVFTDYDNDHDLDIIVNHDFGYKAAPSVMLINQYPKGNFKERGKEINMNLKINAMGTAVGDYNNDGLLDYYITNIRFNQFMVNPGNGKPFVNKAKESGMDYVSISWGANFADFDHDMDLDLYVANGDLNPNDVPLADFYFENNKGIFTEKAPVVGLNDYGVGRGSVVFDMDNDGDLDILVVNQKPVLEYPVESRTKLFRNDSTTGNWFKVILKGKESDAQGIGSRVKIVVGKNKMIREIDGGSSHLSQNSTIAHFGVGTAQTIDSVIVTWVGGKTQIYLNQKANNVFTVLEMPSEERAMSIWIWEIIFLVTAAIVLIYVRSRHRVRTRNISIPS